MDATPAASDISPVSEFDFEPWMNAKITRAMKLAGQKLPGTIANTAKMTVRNTAWTAPRIEGSSRRAGEERKRHQVGVNHRNRDPSGHGGPPCRTTHRPGEDHQESQRTDHDEHDNLLGAHGGPWHLKTF